MEVKSQKADFKTLVTSEDKLKLLESVVCSVFLDVEKTPVFFYECRPGKELNLKIIEFLGCMNEELGSLAALKLPVPSKVAVRGDERLTVRLYFDEPLSVSCENDLIQTRKSLEGMGLMYSRHQRKMVINVKNEVVSSRYTDKSVYPRFLDRVES